MGLIMIVTGNRKARSVESQEQAKQWYAIYGGAWSGGEVRLKVDGGGGEGRSAGTRNESI